MGADDVYFCSLSSRTIVYKGQLKPEQVHRCILLPLSLACRGTALQVQPQLCAFIHAHVYDLEYV